METLILTHRLLPSYLSKIWRIDIGGDKQLLIPSGKLRWPVTSIVNKVINPILSTEVTDMERIYHEKIKPFQECWINLVEVYQKNKAKQQPSMNLSFYDRTLKLVEADPIFNGVKSTIIETVEILKDSEMTISSIINSATTNRMKLLEDVLRLNEIDVNDFLNSLYGSYMALVCFWYIVRNKRHCKTLIPIISGISNILAVNLGSYAETLDIVTDLKEMDLMKRAEQWERQKHTLQNKPQ